MPIRTTNEHGPRHYYDTADPSVHYPSVTRIAGMLPKDLSYWNATMCAERAIASVSYLPQMVSNSHKHTVSYLASAAKDYTKKAADKGSAIHDMAERMLLGWAVDLSSIAAKYSVPLETLSAAHDNLAAFLDRVQPELVHAEHVAWSDEHKYAGSFDISWRFKVNERGVFDPQGEKRLDMTDTKSGKNVYASVAVQLAAYAQAECVIDPEDEKATREPSPTYDGMSVLHLNESVCTLIDIPKKVWAPAWSTFLACVDFERAAYAWQGFGWGYSKVPGHEDKALGHSIYTKSGRRLTGTERRG